MNLNVIDDSSLNMILQRRLLLTYNKAFPLATQQPNSFVWTTVENNTVQPQTCLQSIIADSGLCRKRGTEYPRTGPPSRQQAYAHLQITATWVNG
uniref:Uncharacterized protein n=1 Tax=Heterorhabditis bacteriophora TaxID=37862 RepID=A0A1I7X1Z1_HETBA